MMYDIKSLASLPKVGGETLLIIDASCSMLFVDSMLDSAIALVVELKERCESLVIYASGGDDYTKTDITEKVPDYYGLALDESIRRGIRCLGGGGIYPKQAVDHVSHYEMKPDLLIIITDGEFSEVPKPYGKTCILVYLDKIVNIEGFFCFTIKEFKKWLETSYQNLSTNFHSKTQVNM